MLCLFILLLIVWTYKTMFNKKILVLLSLEGAMLTMILFFTIVVSPSISSIFYLILLSVFMVLDSVFGITLLTSSSRLSNASGKVLS